MNEMLHFLKNFLGVFFSLFIPVALIYTIVTLLTRFLGESSAPLVVFTVLFGIIAIVGAIVDWVDEGKDK